MARVLQPPRRRGDPAVLRPVGCLSVMALVLAGATFAPVPARAATGGCEGVSRQVDCEVQAKGGGVSAFPDNSRSGSARTKQVVDHRWGIRYEEDYFANLPVVEGRQCFTLAPANPQPAMGDPIWRGNTSGAIYVCDFLDHNLGLCARRQFWVGPDEQVPVTPPPPDPVVLAQRAVSHMGLSSIDIGIVPEDAPGRVGVIGLPVWMWVADRGPSTTGPITTSATAAIWTVTATATLNRIVWEMGDGRTVTCAGPGTPYEDSFGTSPSPDCGHVYSVPGEYTVSATSHWTVNWSGIGRTGSFPMQFTSTTRIVEAEVQVLNQ